MYSRWGLKWGHRKERGSSLVVPHDYVSPSDFEASVKSKRASQRFSSFQRMDCVSSPLRSRK